MASSKGKLRVSLTAAKALAGFLHGFLDGFRHGRAGPTPSRRRLASVCYVPADPPHRGHAIRDHAIRDDVGAGARTPTGRARNVWMWARCRNNINDTSEISDVFEGVEQRPRGHRVRMIGMARPIGADDRPFLMA